MKSRLSDIPVGNEEFYYGTPPVERSLPATQRRDDANLINRELGLLNAAEEYRYPIVAPKKAITERTWFWPSVAGVVLLIIAYIAFVNEEK